MANTTLPLSTRLSQKPNIKRNERIKKAELGDGYSARSPNGKNWVYYTVELQWEVLTYTEFQTIQDAVALIQPDGWFTWTLPNEATVRKFRMEDFSFTYYSTYVDAKMSLKEIFV